MPRGSSTCRYASDMKLMPVGHRAPRYFNYLLLLPLHFLRSMETASGGSQTLFSTAEKEFLLSQRHVFNDAVVNFLSVRRSMMFVATIFCMLTLAVQMAEVPQAFENRRPKAT